MNETGWSPWECLYSASAEKDNKKAGAQRSKGKYPRSPKETEKLINMENHRKTGDGMKSHLGWRWLSIFWFLSFKQLQDSILLQ